jgi:FkbM family methyltransferase
MDSTAVNPEIDDQGAELSLIAALVPSLDERSAIDVGSERGAVAAALRKAGLDPMWLLEPFPGSVELLRERFGGDSGVQVLGVAAGAEDGTSELHLARDLSGASLDAFNTLRPGGSGPDLVWDGSVEVQIRSLDSLRSAGEVPGRVGLLKIDAEGADAEVLRGASSIDADLVMVEFWGNLPDTLGPCPFELEELRSLVEPLGPRHFLFVRHGPRHLGIGRWDTLVFVADSLVEAAEAALPALDRALLQRSERITAEQERAAADRLELIERLTEAADERLELLERRSRFAKMRDALIARLRTGSGSSEPDSAERRPLDAVDDVEQETGGSSPV